MKSNQTRSKLKKTAKKPAQKIRKVKPRPKKAKEKRSRLSTEKDLAPVVGACEFYGDRETDAAMLEMSETEGNLYNKDCIEISRQYLQKLEFGN